MPPERRDGPSFRGRAGWRVLCPSPQTFKNRITFARLETVRVPTLLISGGADLYAPPPVMRLFADHMRGAEMLAVPDAGHSTFWEQAELFNRTFLPSSPDTSEARSLSTVSNCPPSAGVGWIQPIFHLSAATPGRGKSPRFAA
jgi:hypothetical protein